MRKEGVVRSSAVVEVLVNVYDGVVLLRAARYGGRATIDADLGYVSGRAPRERGFKTALDAEIEAMRSFLTGRDDL